jgi:hypothetical protein
LTASLHRRIVLAAPLALAAGLVALAAPGLAQSAPSLFGMAELDGQRFILVAAPIGSSGSRSQLNIYEQINSRRPCYAVAPGKPAVVTPLLTSFDFSGICGRYIDANGFSVRIGDRDLATVYRLSVINTANDTQLMALPTSGGGPELVVARTQGSGTGFLKLEFEPGWRLARRHFRGRALGHVYVYRDSWPATEAVAPAAAGGPVEGPAAAPSAAPPAPAPTPTPKGGSAKPAAVAPPPLPKGG